MLYSSLNDFIEKNRKWLKLEQEEDTNFIKTLMTQVNVWDLEQLGYSTRTKIDKMKMGIGKRWVLVLKQESQNILKIKQGDLVQLYDWNKAQSAQFYGNIKSQGSGVIQKINREKISVLLDKNSEEFQIDEQYVKCLVISDSQITYLRYIEVLNQLQKIGYENPLVKLLFPEHVQKYPHNNIQFEEQKLSGQTFQELNKTQIEAVNRSLASPNLFIIHGPPGTGKTRTLCEYMKQAVNFQRKKILATAPSNVAVDNMIERLSCIAQEIKFCRLGNPARMNDSVKKSCLDVKIRKTSSWNILKQLKQDIFKNQKRLQRADKYPDKKAILNKIRDLQKEKKQLEMQAIKEVIEDSSIIFATNAGCGEKLFRKMTFNISFDVVVIDECAQSLEVSCWIPILKARKIVLAGDHKQLPPTVKSNQQGLEITLFERILKDIEQYSGQYNCLLKIQYRMNEQIMNWSSKEVYSDQLEADITVKNHTLNDLNQFTDKPMILLYLDTSGCGMWEAEKVSSSILQDMNKSKFNQGEAGLVLLVVEELNLLNIKNEDIGIITPYSAQVQCIKSYLEGQNIEISTVDGFQGREKECIIISLVRSNKIKQVGFLSESRRMNVAVTRAKRFVCIIGNNETVSSDPFLKTLLNYFIENGDVRSAQMYANDERIKMHLQDTQQFKGQNQNEKQQEKNKKNKNKKKNNDINDNQIIKVEDKMIPLIEDVDFVKFYETQILNFLNDTEDKKFEIHQVNSYKRKIIHELAEKYKLAHESIGNSKIKTITLQKIEEQNNNQIQITQPEPQTQVEEEQAQQKKVVQKKVKSINVFEQLQYHEINSEEEEETKQQLNQQKQNQQKQKKVENKKKPKQKSKEQDDENQFLEEISSKYNNNFCAYCDNGIQCPKPINLLSIECKHCQKKYCSKHQLAEEHGCGDAAKEQARSQFIQSFTKDNKLNEERDKLSQQLKEKLKKAQNERNKKQKKK